MIKSGCGLKKHFLVAKMYTCLGWQLFAGQSEKREITFVLRKNTLVILLSSYFLLVYLCAIGQGWMIETGVNMMVKTAFQMLKETRQAAPVLMIMGMESETEDGVTDLEKGGRGCTIETILRLVLKMLNSSVHE
jgi:hypothetical protein